MKTYSEKCKMLRKMLLSNNLEFIMEAHDGISAKIVEETGFKGIWLSGLSMSASLGVRDNNELSFKEVADHAFYVASRVDIPVLLDMDTGYGDFNTARTALRHLESAGIAGVVIEDKKFPKTNSFLNNGLDKLADPEEFALKIKAMKESQTDPNFVVIARLEELIIGAGLDEAIKRGKMYADAGADAILVHSKKKVSEDIDDFMAVWNSLPKYKDVPIVIVPTKYYSTPTNHFRDLGISLVIWANHNIRTAIMNMQKTCKTIFEDESLVGVEDKIVPVSEIFRLQGNDELVEAEKVYTPQVNSNAIILGASDTKEGIPKIVMELNDKSLLRYQLDTYKSNGISDIKLVTGSEDTCDDEGMEDFLYKEGFSTEDVTVNRSYKLTTEIDSLELVKDNIKKDTIISYGDLLFRDHIISDLVSYKANADIVVTASYYDKVTKNYQGYSEYLTLDRPYDRMKPLGYYASGFSCTGDLVPLVPDQSAELVGVVKVVTDSAVEAIKQELVDMRHEGLRMCSLLQKLKDLGYTIAVNLVPRESWSDINEIIDIVTAGGIK